MTAKKYRSVKYTIQIAPDSVASLKALKLLAMAGERGKAKLIVEALNFYNEAHQNIYDVSDLSDILEMLEEKYIKDTKKKSSSRRTVKKEIINEEEPVSTILVPDLEEEYDSDDYVDEDDGSELDDLFLGDAFFKDIII